MDDVKFQQEFQDHVRHCEMMFDRNAEQFQQLLKLNENNTESITLLIAETRAVVQLHNDIQGVTRLGKGLQTFLVWVIKWPLIGAGIYGMVNWVSKHFG